LQRALRSGMQKKGILMGDVARLDAELRRLHKALKAGEADEALAAANSAQAVLKDVNIDRVFIQAKLLRFNRLFDQAGDSPAAAKVVDMGQDIMSAVESGQYGRANSLLNKSFQLLQAGR
jgi:hypothetical protein